ncbi:uncharacterized protein LAJ45_02502 [Morchella importuna]|uniref:uncharacterized protein n=1 Tax=Morchella importuna TaxID=1174673 RepID=UPI001E8E8B61|nr:uncharacterized protein LAJ45_02502 [Morchella importuna]KAH8153689.1 hypothetical protein LAJ45_02502 [Morchella importuna]
MDYGISAAARLIVIHTSIASDIALLASIIDSVVIWILESQQRGKSRYTIILSDTIRLASIIVSVVISPERASHT